MKVQLERVIAHHKHRECSRSWMGGVCIYQPAQALKIKVLTHLCFLKDPSYNGYIAMTD